jgi:hypothetical protein
VILLAVFVVALEDVMLMVDQVFSRVDVAGKAPAQSSDGFEEIVEARLQYILPL